LLAFSVLRALSLSVVSDLGDESFIGHRGEDAVGFGSRRIIGQLRGSNRDELDAHAVDPIERFPDGIHTMRARHPADVQLKIFHVLPGHLSLRSKYIAPGGIWQYRPSGGAELCSGV
jgi:hypothetical protein